MSARLCYTCGRVMADVLAQICSTPYCTARREAERDAKAERMKRPIESDASGVYTIHAPLSLPMPGSSVVYQPPKPVYHDDGA